MTSVNVRFAKKGDIRALIELIPIPEQAQKFQPRYTPGAASRK
jgi:hypothetical protein